MDRNMKAPIKKARNMEQENMSGLMDLVTKEIGLIIKSVDLEYIHGLMEE